MKTARIILILKVRAPTELSDYRPISVASVLSNIYEKLVMKQVVEFIKNHELYQSTQPGYRTKHSSSTPLVKFRDDIIKAINKGEITRATFADFVKVFKYLSHRQYYAQIDDKS